MNVKNKSSHVDFADALITAINSDRKDRIAYNLSVDDAPTNVRRWIPTGSIALDYACANRRNGGLPEGRIIEIFGPPSIGKSHIALQLAKSTQHMGGIVVYIDTENATSIENMNLLGVDAASRFVYVQAVCVEDIFSVIDETIKRAREHDRDVPVLVIWDSIAASVPKAELMGDYDKETIGLKARALSKGFRKITEAVGANKVTLVCLNQIRTRVGVMYGDPDVAPGGFALPFHASIRIKLGAGSTIKTKDGDIVGINVSARTVKNKVAPPFRKVEFEIHFGVGIREHEQLLDILRVASNESPIAIGDGKLFTLLGESAWKTLNIIDAVTGEILIERKYTKSGFAAALTDSEIWPFVDNALSVVLTKRAGSVEIVTQADCASDGNTVLDT